MLPEHGEQVDLAGLRQVSEGPGSLEQLDMGLGHLGTGGGVPMERSPMGALRDQNPRAK